MAAAGFRIALLNIEASFVFVSTRYPIGRGFFC
jgi:hypothetical protein